MNRISFLPVLCAAALAVSCGERPLYDAGTPLSVRMVESEIVRNPSPTTLDGIPAGRVKWNYTSGLELLAMMDAGEAYGRPDFYDYALRYYDTIVRPDNSVITYKTSNYNLDHICPGRPLFTIAERTGEPRFHAVLDTLFVQLQEHPRNDDGGFWHKKGLSASDVVGRTLHGRTVLCRICRTQLFRERIVRELESRHRAAVHHCRRAYLRPCHGTLPSRLRRIARNVLVR